MRNGSFYFTFLLLNGPFALAIASEKNSKSSSFFQGKRLATFGNKLKEKTDSLKKSWPDAISLNLRGSDLIDKQSSLEEDQTRSGDAYNRDRLSISLFLSEFKERTGDLSQMVRYVMKSRENTRGDSQRVVSISGGSAVFSRHHIEMNWFDIIARKFCIYLGGIVGMQSLGTILSDNNCALFNEVRIINVGKKATIVVHCGTNSERKLSDCVPFHSVLVVLSYS